MTLPISYRKIFVSTILLFLFNEATSQLRTDGYYSFTKVSKTGDTTFHIFCFTANGQWTDTSGYGNAPRLSNAPLASNSNSYRYTYNVDGNKVTLTVTPINLPQYHIDNCPCTYWVRVENDGIFGIEWRNNQKKRRSIKAKYLFVPFQNDN